jgi:hypothetical protein
MPNSRWVKVTLRIPEQNDLAVVAAALDAEGKPGLTDLEGNYNRSGALRLLLRERKQALKQQPSPVEGVSMWDYLKEQVKAQGKLPWPDKASYDAEEETP